MPGLDEGPRLARLNETERELLELLAQGHTAKSIAANPQTGDADAPQLSAAPAEEFRTTEKDEDFADLFKRRLAAPPDLGRLHSQLRTEPRDAEWADRTEAALGRHYADIPHIGGAAGRVRVICAATICEVVGSFAPGLSDAHENIAMDALQGAEIQSKADRLGLKSEIMSFTFSKERKNLLFATYWLRAAR